MHTNTLPVPTAPRDYAPVHSLHTVRRLHEQDDTICVTQGQAVVYVGALLVTFTAAITCGVACIAIWIQVHS